MMSSGGESSAGLADLDVPPPDLVDAQQGSGSERRAATVPMDVGESKKQYQTSSTTQSPLDRRRFSSSAELQGDDVPSPSVSSPPTVNVIGKAIQRLSYRVVRASGHSGMLRPENVLVDLPSDAQSRWSSDSNRQPQFLLLQLERPAVVALIKFGKFEKTHVCNIKRFKVFGGLSEDGMIELFDGGLKNDATPERFALKNQINSRPFPCQFIKIVPLQSWGPSFNFSIWYVELHGDDRPSVVDQCVQWYNEYRDREALRLCLKFLRDRRYHDVCDELQQRSGVILEHPLITRLYTALVERKDFEEVHSLLSVAAKEGLYSEYLSEIPYEPEWVQLCSSHGSGVDDEVPGMRGGHQMVLDTNAGIIYMFGGWDGSQDLGDFWAYTIAHDRWRCISRNVSAQGGPSARSCHKMVLDTTEGEIFVLGRYCDVTGGAGSPSSAPDIIDRENAMKLPIGPFNCDFYVYRIDDNSWHLICDDTAAMGGPRLIFDHQLVIDNDSRIIYCFGGRVISENSRRDVAVVDLMRDASSQSSEPTHSGFYAYHIPTNAWTLLRDDTPLDGYVSCGVPIPIGRCGHSMLLHQGSRKIYIFAGQRGRNMLSDMLIYDIDRDELAPEIDGNGIVSRIPAAGCTQRATLDADLEEIYVLAGSMKDQNEEVHNSMWVYSIRTKRWSCVYKTGRKTKVQPPDEDDIDLASSRDENPTRERLIQVLQRAKRMMAQRQKQPCPRYAHQLCYDSTQKVHFLFGGNPGKKSSSQSEVRLDDFWKLILHKASLEDVLEECRWKVKKVQYVLMVNADPVVALQYLQTQLVPPASTQHANLQRSQELQALTGLLFEMDSSDSDEEARQQNASTSLKGKPPGGSTAKTMNWCKVDEVKAKALLLEVFNELYLYFPLSSRPPMGNLVDMITAVDK